GGRKGRGLLVVEWAARARPEKPPVAILIEMGLKDTNPTTWTGRATVRGARVVHREGYRFRKEDKLLEPDGWQASSHRGLRVPAKQPAVNKMEGVPSVGAVLHLEELQAAATLSVDANAGGDEKAVVPVKALLSGRRIPLWNGRAVARRISPATAVVLDKTEDDFPAAAYGPDGTLWLAYI